MKIEEDSEEETEENKMGTMPTIEHGTTGSFTMKRLDASMIDVYKGTQGVIVMMDPTKKWTFEYAKKEIENIPTDIDVLLLVNYRDMGDYRVISEQDISQFASFVNDKNNVKVLECSMKNSFGLKSIITFFNLPFLKLQRNTILQQLKLNGDDISNVEHELALIAKDQNYDLYVSFFFLLYYH